MPEQFEQNKEEILKMEVEKKEDAEFSEEGRKEMDKIMMENISSVSFI